MTAANAKQAGTGAGSFQGAATITAGWVPSLSFDSDGRASTLATEHSPQPDINVSQSLRAVSPW